MPPAYKVQLFPHDRAWEHQAAEESRRVAAAIGSCLIAVHHIGSTAIPGIHAKAILDLMPVVSGLAELDERKEALEALGYAWWGELGLPGRRYCTNTDPVTGARRIHLHCYAEGSPEILRHLAFRDYLRHNPGIARAYDREKRRCRDLHADNSHAYSDCKDAWIKRIEAEALAARLKLNDIP